MFGVSLSFSKKKIFNFHIITCRWFPEAHFHPQVDSAGFFSFHVTTSDDQVRQTLTHDSE
jgi:hypothetical protein